MTLLKYDYYEISCNGRLNNMVHPECPAVTEGALSDTESLYATAKEAGWIEHGKAGHLCPSCAAKVAPAEPKPAKPRAPKTAEQIEATFPGGGAV